MKRKSELVMSTWKGLGLFYPGLVWYRLDPVYELNSNTVSKTQIISKVANI